MKIEIHSNDFDEKCRCHLCGQIFFPSAVVAKAFKESGEYLTDVCGECIAVGPEGMSKRMRTRADYLRQIAAELEGLARSEIKSPSIAQLNIMNQIENAMR